MTANKATQEHVLQFAQSLRDWGHIFMLTVWLQSIMASAIAMKDVGYTRTETVINPDREYFKRRNRLMKEELSTIWKKFTSQFPNSVTREERLVADMIVFVRNQLAHCHISSGRQSALFLPKPGSQKLLDKLKSAGWIETPGDGGSDPEMLIMREGDRRWFEKNRAMITEFSENTILRVTRAHGIGDAAIC